MKPEDRVTALPIETILANLLEARKAEAEFLERERLAEASLEALDIFQVD